MRAIVGIVFLATVAPACGDPVHDDAVNALGPEKPGVRHGPLHRPGQPCLTCHGGDGPASFVMDFGGTVFATLDGDTPGAGATVRLLDSQQHTYDVTANCVGNFWVPRGAFAAVFPVTAAVTMSLPGATMGESSSRVMTTQMRRNGSCGECHVNPASAASPGQIYAIAGSVAGLMPDCSGDQSPKGTAGTIPECSTPNPMCAAPYPTYAKDMAPILNANCANCHRPGGENTQVLLDTYENASAAATKAYPFAAHCQMPPPPLAPLAADQINTFACWLSHGKLK
jgi:hypothetical protein